MNQLSMGAGIEHGARHMQTLPLASWLLPLGSGRRKLWTLNHTRSAMQKLFGEDVHLARVRSLANGVAGVLNASVVSIAAIGRAYAQLAQVGTKSGIKQVDRLLSNEEVKLEHVLPLWIRHVVGTTLNIVVAMDWTDFDDDDHATLCAYLVTTHGRATPLAWKTVKKSTLKNKRTGHELKMVEQLHDWLPASVSVTLMADRAFGYAELYELLGTYGWDYIIRFRENIIVTEADSEGVAAADLVLAHGRVRKLVDAKVTRKKTKVPAVVLVKRTGMKEAWCLATSLATADANEIVRAYSKRFTIEETFRDHKDITFGLGLRATHIADADRRDRLLLLIAIAYTLLTLLGAASEASKLDKTLKANTSAKRTMSLFNQGLYWYSCLDTMRDDWLDRLIDAYEKILRGHEFLAEILRFEPPRERAN
jgi:hypothetical protein